MSSSRQIRSSPKRGAHRISRSRAGGFGTIASATGSGGTEDSARVSETASSNAPPPLRVAVVGAGPCGLTTALALRHHGFDHVKVYDKFPEIKPALGAAFNLNGGAAVLDKLGVLDAFRENNNPMRVVRTRRVGGDALGRFELMNIPIPALIRGDAAANESLVSKTDGSELCGTVMRCDLLRALGEKVPASWLSLGPEFEVVGTRVTPGDRLDARTGETRASVSTLRFADGTESEPFDLIVGCDGIKSAVRAAMFGPYASRNSGIRIVFGCTGDGAVSEARPDARPEAEHGEIHQWFGDGCYALVYTAGGSAGPKQHNVAVCIADDADLDENAEWQRSDGSVVAGGASGSSTRGSSDDDAHDRCDDDARRNARARSAALSALRRYAMPESVTNVAENCDRFFDVGVRYHDPLQTWSDDLSALVLAGDACHAMPPFLGQGANQALQDAWVLAEQLGAMEENTAAEKKAALRRYEAIRKPPTTAIMLSSRVIGFVETGSGLVSVARDVAFGVLGKLGIAGKIFLKNAVPVLK